MGSSKKRRRQLKLAQRAHPLSHIIRSITSKTKHRLLREHHDRRRQPRTHTENLLSSNFTFSGYGARFQQYGKLNHKASGWNEERIDRLLEPRVSNEEMNLPDGPEPRLDSDYIDKHLLCLPEELRRNIRRQGVKKRQRRIESYFVNTYGYIPPRVRRLISGSYRPSHKGLPALRRTAKSDARRRYIQHLSGSSSPSSTVSTPPRRQQQPRRASAAARKVPADSSPSTSHMSPLGFDMSPISPSIHDIIQQVQGKQPLPPNRPSSSLSSRSPTQQGTPFQVVNRHYDRSRSPSVEITGDQAGHTPPPPTPPTPPGEKQYEEYDYEDSPPYSTRSNFMGFSPLQGLPADTPPPPSSATPGQVAMNLVEDSAKDLETVLNVAETGVKSLLSRIRASEKVVAAAETTPQPSANTDESSWITNDNDSDAALHDILQEEFNHPPINTSIGDQRQHAMEMESMYDDLLDHNNTPIPPQTPPRERRLELPPLYTPASRKPVSRIAYKQPMPLPPQARIAHKAPMAPPPPPLPLSRKKLAPPYPVLSPPSMFRDRRRKSASTYPILSPPSMFRDKTKNFGSQVGNDRGVHNSLYDIFHDFCIGKKNTREATHKIMDIVHQVSKYNIR